nr:MAG TPA: Large polyvalent protein-associated domain 3 [Caudoviricetes sp.]
MAVQMPDLVAYGKNKSVKSTAGSSTSPQKNATQMPDLVAYGKRKSSVSQPATTQKTTTDAGKQRGFVADPTRAKNNASSRVKNIVTGATKSTGSAFTNLGGVLAEGAGKLNTRIANQNAGKSLQSDHDAVKRYEKMLRDVKWANGKAMTAADVKQVQSYLSAAKRRIAAHEGYTKAVEQSDKAVADKAYQKADRLSQSSAADVAQAKKGLGPVGQFAVDLGVQGVQMAGDVAASAVIPGAGLALMTARSAGSSAQRARQAGATYGQQLAYGLGSGALSLATEKISNVASPFKKAFGGGVLDNAISGALSKLNNSAAGRVALSMISEGGEEFIEDIFQPVLQRATYDPSARFDLSEALYDAAVGAAMGGIGAGVDVIRQRGNGQADAQPTQEVRTEVREDTYTPSPANVAEGTQNAAPGVETAENIRVGQATTIKKPYKGEVPTQTQRQNTAPVQVSSEALTQAQNSIAGARGLESSFPVQSFKSTLKNVYKSIFKPAKGVVVEGATFNGQPYTVDIGNKVLGKVISDTKLTPEKLALLGNVSEVVQNGTYVGSGEYTQHSGKDRPTIRYDYFETPVSINGESYIAKFDVEVVPGANNYRTHQVVKMDLTPTEASLVGPEPTASSAASSPIEGTRPLNANDSIAQGAENVKNGGAAGFDTPGDAVAGAVNTPFDTMQAKSDEFYPVNPNSAQRIQADQRRAPSEVPVVNPDTGRNVEKTVSTILNSPLTSPEMATVYENAIAGGTFDYDVVTDRDAVQQAQAKIARDGWREVANSFIAKAELGQRITKADTAEAISAYNLAISEGDHKAAFELSTAIADAAHDSAQMVQAMNLMNRLTPEGRLLTLRRLVDKMNDRAARQNRAPRQSTTNSGDVEGARVDYIDKVTGFTLSDELATNYLMAETDAERAAAWDAITTSIADQIPSTFREKANFWRYTSMLTNPTTHIRNVMGNAIQMGARKIKNGIGTAIERAVIKDPSQRTKAVNVDKDLKAFAKGQYETDQSAAMGSGKYSDATAAGIEREIQSKRKMFKGEDVLSRAVQGIGDLNSRALDYEDVIFNRAAYVDSFAQALQAKGVTAAEAHAGTRAADVEAARAYAIEEAQRATYRNTTALSEALSKMGRYDESGNIVERGKSFLVDALLPFRKTPANILTTGLDYSPVGLLKTIFYDAGQVRKGNMSSADMVDHISSGLTGSGIFALGAYLAAEGLLHVRAGDDDKEEDFEKSMGGQDYAIQIGDKSYTLDWALPAAMPLFAGASVEKSYEKGGGTFDAFADAIKNISSVVWETSMLSSLNDLVSYWSYADDPGAYLVSKAASSYAGQYIPTVGSKVASALDDTVRKSYVEKGSGQVASDVNYFLQGAAKKVPGARNQLQPSIDLWGNEVSNGSAPERVFQSFLSPGFLKAQDNSPATQEIRRLAKATGESAVYPAAAEKSFMVNGETKYLTGEEYTKYAKTMGSTRKQIVENMLKSKGYQKLSDDDKAKAISYAYEYAKVKGRQAVSSYKPSNSSFSKGALASVLPPDMYIIYKVTADKDNNGSVTSVESAQALKNLTGLTDRQRGKAWEEKNSTTKPEKNPFTGALVEAGASVSTSISILDKYRKLYNAEGMKPKEKAADFRAYVYGLGLTPAQIAAAQSTYTFFGSYPIEW